MRETWKSWLALCSAASSHMKMHSIKNISFSMIATKAEAYVHIYDSILFDFNLNSIHALLTNVSKCVMLLGSIHSLQYVAVKKMLTVVWGKVAAEH